MGNIPEAGGVNRDHEADAWEEPDFESRSVRNMKVETLEWHIKVLLPCFHLSPYFGVFDSPLFRFLMVRPSSV